MQTFFVLSFNFSVCLTSLYPLQILTQRIFTRRLWKQETTESDGLWSILRHDTAICIEGSITS
jgi:hypothetical protein